MYIDIMPLVAIERMVIEMGARGWLYLLSEQFSWKWFIVGAKYFHINFECFSFSLMEKSFSKWGGKKRRRRVEKVCDCLCLRVYMKSVRRKKALLIVNWFVYFIQYPLASLLLFRFTSHQASVRLSVYLYACQGRFIHSIVAAWTLIFHFMCIYPSPCYAVIGSKIQSIQLVYQFCVWCCCCSCFLCREERNYEFSTWRKVWACVAELRMWWFIPNWWHFFYCKIRWWGEYPLHVHLTVCQLPSLYTPQQYRPTQLPHHKFDHSRRKLELIYFISFWLKWTTLLTSKSMRKHNFS